MIRPIVARSMNRASSASTAAYAGVPASARIAPVSSNQTSAIPSYAGSPLR